MKDDFKKIFDTLEKLHEKEKNLKLNSRVLVLDALNNFIRIWVTTPTTNDDGKHIGGIVGFLYSLGVNIRRLRPTRVFIVLDGKNSSAKRKKIFPAYKANRGGGTRLNRAHKWANDEEERKQMQYQILRVIKYLKNLPITFVMIDNIEADDSIGCLANIYREKEELQEFFIVSTDKDFYQLIDDRIKVWNPITKILIDKSKVLELYDGVKPNNFALYKSLLGDRSDNIPGIRGLGEKTILKHYSILKEDIEHSPNDVLQYAEDNMDTNRAFKLLEGKSNQYLLNYKLMKLSDESIPKSSILKIVGSVNNKIPEINLINIQELVKQDKLWSAFKNINAWISTNFLTLNTFAKNKE